MTLRAPQGQLQGSATTAMLRHRQGAMTRLSAAAVALRPAAERSKPGAGNGLNLPSAENNSPPPSARRAPLKQSLSVALLVSALLALSCASKTGPARGTGTKVLEGVVVERDHDAPGAGGAGFQGTGNYYLVIEARDGDATAHYRYQVSYRQWFRFPEGSHVRITLRNNFLQDIQPNE